MYCFVFFLFKVYNYLDNTKKGGVSLVRILENANRLRGSLTLTNSQNRQKSFKYGFFYVKFLFFDVVCVVYL